jgi:hypothetical protein
MPMPTIGGRQVKWICEFCYTMLFTDRLPDGWDWIYQSAVCPECRERVAQAGGYHVVVAGAYAEGPDPRSVAGADKPAGCPEV